MTAPSWLTARPIAHRGLHDRSAGRVENTLGAAEAAMASGFGIECDVQVSSDGEAVVFHDHALDRLTSDSGPVRNRTAKDLSRLSVGGTPDRIPTLAGFLNAIAGRVPLVVEIKSRFDGDERLARRTVEVLAGRTDPVVVKSFDPAIVRLVREIAPALPRGIVAQARYEDGDWTALDPDLRHAMANLLHWPDTQPDFLSWRSADLPSAAPFLARTLAHIPVMTWTVRGREEQSRVREMADQVVFEGYVPD